MKNRSKMSLVRLALILYVLIFSRGVLAETYHIVQFSNGKAWSIQNWAKLVRDFNSAVQTVLPNTGDWPSIFVYDLDPKVGIIFQIKSANEENVLSDLKALISGVKFRTFEDKPGRHRYEVPRSTGLSPAEIRFAPVEIEFGTTIEKANPSAAEIRALKRIFGYYEGYYEGPNAHSIPIFSQPETGRLVLRVNLDEPESVRFLFGLKKLEKQNPSIVRRIRFLSHADLKTRLLLPSDRTDDLERMRDSNLAIYLGVSFSAKVGTVGDSLPFGEAERSFYGSVTGVRGVGIYGFRNFVRRDGDPKSTGLKRGYAKRTLIVRFDLKSADSVESLLSLLRSNRSSANENDLEGLEVSWQIIPRRDLSQFGILPSVTENSLTFLLDDLQTPQGHDATFPRDLKYLTKALPFLGLSLDSQVSLSRLVRLLTSPDAKNSSADSATFNIGRLGTSSSDYFITLLVREMIPKSISTGSSGARICIESIRSLGLRR